MITITAILEPQPDGTVRLPVPDELRHSRVEVIATMRRAVAAADIPSDDQIRAAFQQLRQRGTFRDISDPVAWQRSVRAD